MAVSDENSGSRLQSPQHTEQFSTCLAQQFAKSELPAPCDSFLHHPFLSDFADGPGLHECWDAAQPASAHLLLAPGPITAGNVNEECLFAQRIHKSDREKLRRDKLNEQFSELASALDPDRPKNDKATILGESIQAVKDLREEVKRLKMENVSLLDESRDLTQEKNELREETATLKNETQQLQSQIQQLFQASLSWMALDPLRMMGATALPYPVPVQQPILVSQMESHPVSGPPGTLVTPAPYMPLVPPLGAFHMHPSLQAYTMLGNRPGDGGGNPYLYYPSFSQPLNSHSHIERPYAQYPSPVQPVPGYVIQISPSLGSESQLSPSSNTPAYKPCVPGIPAVPACHIHGSCQQSKGGSHHLSASQSSPQLTPTESKGETASTMASPILQGTP